MKPSNLCRWESLFGLPFLYQPLPRMGDLKQKGPLLRRGPTRLGRYCINFPLWIPSPRGALSWVPRIPHFLWGASFIFIHIILPSRSSGIFSFRSLKADAREFLPNLEEPHLRFWKPDMFLNHSPSLYIAATISFILVQIFVRNVRRFMGWLVYLYELKQKRQSNRTELLNKQNIDCSQSV